MFIYLFLQCRRTKEKREMRESISLKMKEVNTASTVSFLRSAPPPAPIAGQSSAVASSHPLIPVTGSSFQCQKSSVLTKICFFFYKREMQKNRQHIVSIHVSYNVPRNVLMSSSTRFGFFRLLHGKFFISTSFVVNK